MPPKDHSSLSLSLSLSLSFRYSLDPRKKRGKIMRDFPSRQRREMITARGEWLGMIPSRIPL